jgi:prolyl oligopeptidase
MSLASQITAFRRVIVLFALAGTAAHAIAQTPSAAGPAPRYPDTVKRPASDTYTGTAGATKVTENYRWLETLDDPAVKDWITLQNTATRRYLDALPFRTAIRDELKQLIGSAPVTRGSFHYAAGRLFALKRQPPKNQPILVVLAAPDDLGSERVVVDPNTRNEKGTTAIDWFIPSHDGKRVAVSLSDNGSEKGTLHVFDTDTGNELSDVVPRVQNPTGGGSVAWNGDDTGFWFTRYPAPMERPADDAGFFQQVWFHKLGTRSSDDTPALTDGLPRIAETTLEATDDGRHVLATVRNGDGGEVAFWLRDPTGRWRQLATFADGFRSATFGHDGRIYALALKGSPRGRVVAMKADQPTLAKAATIVPQGDAVIEDIVPTATRLYVEVLVGGPSALRVYTLAGKALPAPPVEPISTVAIGTHLDGDAILFGAQGYLTPFAWFRLDPKHDDGKPVRTMLSAPPDNTVATDGFAVTRVMARSKDGTDVPVNLVAKKDVALDGSNPTLLTAYGGYGVSTRPRYSRRMLFWLRHGGVLAVANIRGGGEFGEDWHQAGKLTKKQNVFDDFASAARMLIDRGYTNPKKLAIEGGSNGGLLMGAELVQHPELYGAVVSHVGIYDMLRVETTPNGAFNVTEFGTVKDPAQFDALYAYSPYHHVVDGVAYPPLLMTTGINDGRVDPWQSLKMAARLQAANPDGKPVLLRVAGDAGHGQGMSLSSAIELDADTFAFIFASLGMDMAVSRAAPQPTTGPGLPQAR